MIGEIKESMLCDYRLSYTASPEDIHVIERHIPIVCSSNNGLQENLQIVKLDYNALLQTTDYHDRYIIIDR